MSSLQQNIVQQDNAEGWQRFAACSGEMSTAFYPPVHTEDRRAKRLRESRAKAVCASCPVKSDCLDHAITHDERYGIWGGQTAKERRLVLLASK